MERERLEKESYRWHQQHTTLLLNATEESSLLPEKADPIATTLLLERHTTADANEDDTDDALFVKEPVIDIRGVWRKAYYRNYWWVVGHHMMHPCRDEREAEKLCARLKDIWEET